MKKKTLLIDHSPFSVIGFIEQDIFLHFTLFLPPTHVLSPISPTLTIYSRLSFSTSHVD